MTAQEFFDKNTEKIYDSLDMHNRPSISLVEMIWDAAQEEICKEFNIVNWYYRKRYPNGRCP